ncbi:hypothetical protein GCM10017744_079580 [Streptomyces antimycoticus]|uniref:Uncharacterized protein n=1 Tax=Streptomyces antimycoticus TaxID=68175 RepID=A0A4D4K4P5_9ACTN|nr:hypothetical protein SANT12839_021790 [Streptomyces antimycoticus]
MCDEDRASRLLGIDMPDVGKASATYDGDVLTATAEERGDRRGARDPVLEPSGVAAGYDLTSQSFPASARLMVGSDS